MIYFKIKILDKAGKVIAQKSAYSVKELQKIKDKVLATGKGIEAKMQVVGY